METKRLQANSYGIEIAANILKNDGIVAIPTETVYGLAASAFSDSAIKKVFVAKGRPQDNPLIVHIADKQQLELVATDIPNSAYLCAEAFWPGPFTMVLKKKEGISDSVSRGLDTVAVRMPNHNTAREIIRKCGMPLAAPSANISGYPSATTYTHVLDDLDGKIDAVIMDSDCKIGVESTVISLVGDTPRLLRPGAVTVEQLRKILPDIVIDDSVLSRAKEGEKVYSPGMKYKHYSPKAEVFLVEGDNLEFANFVNQKSDAAVLCFEQDKNIKMEYFIYGDEKDDKTLAHSIFSLLRKIDSKNYKAVYVHAPKKEGVGLAVYNRLIRAAAFKVIKL